MLLANKMRDEYKTVAKGGIYMSSVTSDRLKVITRRCALVDFGYVRCNGIFGREHMTLFVNSKAIMVFSGWNINSRHSQPCLKLAFEDLEHTNLFSLRLIMLENCWQNFTPLDYSS